MSSSDAQRARARIVRAGAMTSALAAQWTQRGMQFGAYSWGFPDGSVLVHRPHASIRRDPDDVAQICRRKWAAYNLR